MVESQYIAIATALLAALTSVEAWSPSNDYAPAKVPCDSSINLVRNATGLSPNETAWLEKRTPIAREALRAFLERTTSNFSDTSFMDKLFGDDAVAPKLGVAVSGGGFRAMLSGAGMLAAMDNRTVGANEHGLGGLLQAMTYLSGLSGGNWLTGTLAYNNWTSVQEIIDNFEGVNPIWNLTDSVVNPGGFNREFTKERMANLTRQISEKIDAGYNATMVDAWGRALSYYFFPTLYEAGVGYTWDTLRDAPVFMNGEMPFPISVADSRDLKTNVTNTDTTIFEFNPFEMGSWDPTLGAFADVKYIGTTMNNGASVEQGVCVAGYDNVGLIMGTSSDIFNYIGSTGEDTFFRDALNTLASRLLPNETNTSDIDISLYAPNPFFNTSYGTGIYSAPLKDSEDLFLVDGGEDGQNIPLVPLIQKERDLDIVFALDIGSNSPENWPNGVSLDMTYQRQFAPIGKGTAFPYVPGVDTFMSQGLNKRPTFFGCDARNLTDLAYIPPLVVYIPNAYHTFMANTSTLKLSYSLEERLAMIQNGFESATRANLTEDANFPACVACAIMRRKQQSLNFDLPSECDQCFADYCWDGSLNRAQAITNTTSSPYTNRTNSGYTNSSLTTMATSLVSASHSSDSTSRSSTHSTHKNAGNALVAKHAASFAGVVAAVIELLL